MRRVHFDRPVSSLLALTAAAALVAAVLVDGSGEMMAALPAVLLALSIAVRRYPGEKLLVRLVRGLRRRPRRARHSSSRRLPDAPARGILPLLASVRPLRGPPLLSSLPI